MRTRFDPDRYERSQRCHYLARQVFYPSFFRVALSGITYRDRDEILQSLDLNWGIDRMLNVVYPEFKAPITFTIQERFCDERYQAYQGITITEWNNASNQPSELYKLQADYFVFGYHSSDVENLLQVVAVPIAELKRVLPSLPFERKTNEKKQDFLVIKFSVLQKYGLILQTGERP